jgi:hypothetical protein
MQEAYITKPHEMAMVITKVFFTFQNVLEINFLLLTHPQAPS